MLNIMPLMEKNLTIPLSPTAHQFADRRARWQNSPLQAKTTYLNSLAVYSVQFYLQLLEIPTATPLSQTPLEAAFSESSHLEIPQQDGFLDCRPVLPGETHLWLPPESRRECWAYLAVRLNEALTEATLLGWIENPSHDSIPLHYLHPLESLLDRLPDLATPHPPTRTSLGHWLQGEVDRLWEPLSTLFAGQPALGWRSPTTTPAKQARYGKWVEFKPQGVEVALVVEVMPGTGNDFDIKLELYPALSQDTLPQNLTLEVLDADGLPVMETKARGSSDLQMSFNVEPGEQFAVKLILDDISTTEYFVL